MASQTIIVRGKEYKTVHVSYLVALKYSQMGERLAELEKQVTDEKSAGEYAGTWMEICRLFFGEDTPELAMHLLEGWEVNELSLFFTGAAASTMRKPGSGDKTSSDTPPKTE